MHPESAGDLPARKPCRDSLSVLPIASTSSSATSLDGKYVRVGSARASKRRSALSTDWTTKQDVPSGRLCVRAYSTSQHAEWQREWREAKPGELSEKLGQIARELEREAPAIAKLVEAGERQAQVARERAESEYREWQRKQAERRRAEALKASREQIVGIVQGWALARDLGAFFADAERRAVEFAENERVPMLARVKQAREMFGGLDSLRHFEPWRSPDER